MCKTSFSTLIHNVEAIDKYTQFKVEPRLKLSGLEVSIGEARRYRTTIIPGQSHQQQQTVDGRDGNISSSQERRERREERERSEERERRERTREQRRAMAQQIANPASDERRRVVYSLGLWAQSPSNEGRKERKERVREISAAFFRQNPACTHRLVPWLTREFRVLLGTDHVQFMIQLVLSLISKINLEGDEFPEHLQPFLLTRTTHFLHELVSFARSPFNMAAYDQRVKYDWPTTSGIRDNWDPEATVNVVSGQLEEHSPQAGPSGLSLQQIQQRLFHELTATRWDDSPPYFNPSSSPIVVHGSDSETDEPENIVCVTSDAPTVSSYTVSIANVDSSSLSTATNVTNSSGNVESTTDSLTATASHVTDGGEVGGEHGSQGTCVEEETETRNEEHGVGSSDVNDCHHNSCDAQVSEMAAPEMDESEQTPNTLKPTGHLPHVTVTPSSSTTAIIEHVIDRDPLTTTSIEEISDTQHCTVRVDEEEEEEEEEECIVINAERESDDESLHSSSRGVTISSVVVSSKVLPKGKGKTSIRQSSSQCKAEYQKRHYESETHDKKLKEKKRKNRGKEKEEYGDKKHSHSSRDHSTRKYSRSSSEYHGHSKYRHRHHRSGHCSSSESLSDTDYRGTSRHRHRDKDEMSTDFDEGLDSYCVREKHHRTRLYSDDYNYRGSKANDDDGNIGSHKKIKRTKEGLSLETKQMSVVCDGSAKKHAGVCGEITKHEQMRDSILHEELNTLDQEIVEHKREVLRAMLRSERLKLLHRQLRGEDLPADDSELHHHVGKPLVIDETTPTKEMVQQLADLDRAIVDGKRQVLRVMKKIEEETPNSDVDSS